MSLPQHRNDIDGLKAIAVLPVVFLRCGAVSFRAEFTGVDIFFTISGFVIACSILNDMCAGSFSVANFYFRRIRKNLPVFVAVVIAMTIAATVLFGEPWRCVRRNEKARPHKVQPHA
jgi:peptidoglycan/LPS O-acetylase OafA/YrhL